MGEAAKYTRTAIGLHWIIFILVAGGWALGQYMSGLPFSPQKLRYISWHKWTGVTIFMFVVVRLAWRVYRPAPPLPATIPPLQRKAAVLVYAVMYALLIAIPLTGWSYSSAAGVPTVWLGIVQLPDLLERNKAVADLLKQVHAWLNWTLLVLVLGHIAFALKHHFIDKDEVLARMLPLVKSPVPKS